MKKLILVLLLAAGAWGAISLTDVTNNKFYQREVNGNGAPGGTTRDIAVTYAVTQACTISGRVSNHATGADVIAWVQLRVAGAAGTYTDTIQDVPQGQWYRLSVKSSLGDSAIGTNRFRIGSRGIVFGQSNANPMANNDGAPVDTVDSLTGKYTYTGSQRIVGCRDNWHDITNTKILEVPYISIVPSFVNKIVSLTSRQIPIEVCGYAVDGSQFIGASGTYWCYRNPANHTDGSTKYGVLITSAGAESVEWCLQVAGEGDAAAGITTANYGNGIDSMQKWIGDDICNGNKPQYFFTGIHPDYGTPAQNRVIYNAQALHDSATGTQHLLALSFDIQTGTTAIGSDQHFSALGRQQLARRAAYNSSKYFLGTMAGGMRGPRIDSAVIAGPGLVNVYVTFQNTTSTTLVGNYDYNFELLGGISQWSQKATWDGLKIVVEFADKLLAPGVKLRYAYQSTSVRGDGLNLLTNDSLPIEPYYDSLTINGTRASDARDHYFVGGNPASDTAWSNTSGGARGYGKPDSLSYVFFSSAANVACTQTDSLRCYSFEHLPGYTAAYSSGGKTLRVWNSLIGSANMTLNGNTYLMGDALCDVNSYNTASANLFTYGNSILSWISSESIHNFDCAYNGKRTIVLTSIPGNFFRWNGGTLHTHGGRLSLWVATQNYRTDNTLPYVTDSGYIDGTGTLTLNCQSAETFNMGAITTTGGVGFSVTQNAGSLNITQTGDIRAAGYTISGLYSVNSHINYNQNGYKIRSDYDLLLGSQNSHDTMNYTFNGVLDINRKLWQIYNTGVSNYTYGTITDTLGGDVVYGSLANVVSNTSTFIAKRGLSITTANVPNIFNNLTINTPLDTTIIIVDTAKLSGNLLATDGLLTASKPMTVAGNITINTTDSVKLDTCRITGNGTLGAGSKFSIKKWLFQACASLFTNNSGVAFTPRYLGPGTLNHRKSTDTVGRSIAFSRTYSCTQPDSFGRIGALPGGVSLSSANGGLTGTFTTAGTFIDTVIAYKNAGDSTSRGYDTITVVLPTFTLTVTLPAQGGTITPGAGVHTYDSGATQAISYTPPAGYKKLIWIGSTGVHFNGDSSTVYLTANGTLTVTIHSSTSTGRRRGGGFDLGNGFMWGGR